MFRFLFSESEEGQTLVEYGLLLALIAVIVIAALIFLGPVIADLFTDVGDQLNPVQ
jgi:pilus assembly protein Flp/PilA